MLKIEVLCVGDFKEKYWVEAYAEYLKRCSRFFEIKTQILKEQGKEKESQEIIKKISTGYNILLDISGEEQNSEQIAKKIASISLTQSKITFIIGGSDGVCDSVRKKVNECVSFGKITLPHQLARVVLSEQIYRAGTILNGIRYHK